MRIRVERRTSTPPVVGEPPRRSPLCVCVCVWRTGPYCITVIVLRDRDRLCYVAAAAAAAGGKLLGSESVNCKSDFYIVVSTTAGVLAWTRVGPPLFLSRTIIRRRKARPPRTVQPFRGRAVAEKPIPASRGHTLLNTLFQQYPAVAPLAKHARPDAIVSSSSSAAAAAAAEADLDSGTLARCRRALLSRSSR